MKRKSLSIVLALAVVFSMLPVSMMTVDAASINTLFAQASSTDRNIISETFDAQNTTISSLGITKVGETEGEASFAEIVQGPAGASGKALHLKREQGYNVSTFFYMPLGEKVTSGILTVEYDLYAPTDNLILGAVCNQSWPPAVVTKITPTIQPYDGNGAVDKKVAPDKTKWHDIKFEINTSTSKYSMFVDGVSYCTDYSYRSANYNLNNTGISDLAFWLCNGSDIEVEAYIDNVVVSHKTPGSWVKAIDDDFNNGISSSWTMIKSGSDDVVAAGKTGDSDKNKVVKIGDKNLGDFDGIQQSFASTSGQILFSVDYQITEYNVRSFNVSFDGKNKAGNTVYNAISFITEFPKIYYYTTFFGATKAKDIKSGINSGAWQNIKLLLNIPDNSYSIWHNDAYVTTAPFRYMPDVESIHNIKIGGSPRTWTSALQPLYFDNVKVYTIDTKTPVPVTSGSTELTFDGGTKGEIPQGITGNSNTALAGRTGDDDKNLALKISSLSDKENAATFSFAPETENVDVSFDFNVPSGLTATTACRFTLFDTKGNRAMSVSIYDGRIYCIGTDATTGGNSEQWLLADDNFKTNEWHSLDFHIDIKEGTFTAEINNKLLPNTYTIRNKNIVKDLASGYFSAWSHGDGSPYSVMIDNVVVTGGSEQDLTNYGLLHLVVPSGVTIDRDKNIVYSAPVGKTVGEFYNTISCRTIGSEIVIADSSGNEKNDNDILEDYDTIIISHDNIEESNVYTISPLYEIKLRGIIVGNNEFFEASKVNIPGTAKIGAFIYNYTTSAKTVTAYASVLGGKMYDADRQYGIEVPANTSKYIEFEVDIPDNLSDAELKIMAWDGGNGMAPLCNYKSKFLETSQTISMPTIFSDYMVLQRNSDVNIFGMAPSGYTVSAKYGDGAAVTSTAVNGEFLVKLPMGDASTTEKDLVVAVSDGTDVVKTFTYSHVVVGDVFYGSGQSNMEMKLSNFAGLSSRVTYEPNIRFFDVASLNSAKARVDGGEVLDSEVWNVATTTNYATAGATLYSVAWALRQMGAIEDDVPIGLVKSARGASSITRWMSKDDVTKAEYGYDDDYINSVGDTNGIRPSDAYYAMAQSVVPYTFRAALWYQGEADCGDANYDKMARDMINQMRKDFGYDIPYYIVQLPGYGAYKDWAMFRPVQWNIQNLVDDAHIVVTNDTGQSNDIHPTDKDVVAKRIARHIMKNLYNMNNIAYSGPVYKSASANGNTVTVEFDFVNDGLHGGLCSLNSDGTLPEFELSADGETWHKATASISGDTVILTSGSVSSPTHVRFGWIDGIVKSLANQSTDALGTVKLPLAPFSEKIN